MAPASSAPFIEHIRELRRRIVWSLLLIGVGAGVGYYLYDKLLYVLQLPYGHELYYTTPTGALSFLIKVCLTFGFIVGLPMLTYQLLAFIAPVAKIHTRTIIALYLIASVTLAAAGIGFAYFVSLPAALHFLVNFGDPDSVKALITANEYFNFVLSYLAGFAVLFQIPLLMMGTNRITPLKPKKLLGGTKYMILLSFIIAAVLTPTPDPFNQAIMAGPMIMLYLASICLVAVFGRSRRPNEVQSAVPILQANLTSLAPSPPVTTLTPLLAQTNSKPKIASVQPQRMMSDIIGPARSTTPQTSSHHSIPQRPAPTRPSPVFQSRRVMDIISA